MTSYAALLVLALAANFSDWRMIALTLVSAAGIFLPIPNADFYLVCMLVELLVALLAYRISAPASFMVIRISWMLILFHVLGWWLDGYPDYSPYHAGVKLLEHAELFVCILFSNPIKKRLAHVL